jgi:hypothetical protein
MPSQQLQGQLQTQYSVITEDDYDDDNNNLIAVLKLYFSMAI